MIFVNLHAAKRQRVLVTDRDRPADAVLLTYKTPDGGARIFDMCCELGKAGAYRNPFRASGLWEATVIRSKLPNGRITVEAWAFDAECGRAYPLRNDRFLDAAQ